MHDDLVPKLGCAKCGGKQVGLTYGPRFNENRRAQVPRPNMYERARGG
ncbi:hypothetical protein [Mesorhizobium sp. CN2-181]